METWLAKVNEAGSKWILGANMGITMPAAISKPDIAICTIM
jgi:hypothetical protein